MHSEECLKNFMEGYLANSHCNSLAWNSFFFHFKIRALSVISCEWKKWHAYWKILACFFRYYHSCLLDQIRFIHYGNKTRITKIWIHYYCHMHMMSLFEVWRLNAPVSDLRDSTFLNICLDRPIIAWLFFISSYTHISYISGPNHSLVLKNMLAVPTKPCYKR